MGLYREILALTKFSGGSVETSLEQHRMNVMRAAMWMGACLWLLAVAFTSATAAEIEDLRKLQRQGKYEECLRQTTLEVAQGNYGEWFAILKAQCELTLGKHAEARTTCELALKRYTPNLELRRLGQAASRSTGDAKQADTWEAEITRLYQEAPWRYSDAESMVLIGEMQLERGADAKQVNDQFFLKAVRAQPNLRTGVIAVARLALRKRDFALATELFTQANDTFPEDPEILLGWAEALAGGDREKSEEKLKAALTANARHLPSLLLRASRQMDIEDYAAVNLDLNRILEIQPTHPEALAMQAAVAHVLNDVATEQKSRAKALSTWAKNPVVDHRYGRELSKKYRFAEGAEAQQRALAFDPKFLPAQKQLAEDWLRLGREEEAWALLKQIRQVDPYDVRTYNMLTLHEEMQSFTTIEQDGLLIRMDRREAEVYGPRVVALLKQARAELAPRYGVELPTPIVVEIFPKPADFAARTFGLPQAGPILGVCFGRVITASSPVGHNEHPVNWESVLWHEFTHVVTLTATKNRMPRWLSEGISVYEERRRDPSWGQAMSLADRRRIEAGEFTPVGKLSSAFLQAKKAEDIPFAYLESNRVVEYLVTTYGFPALTAILQDLAKGVSINDALERHAAPLAKLEADFAADLRQQAADFARDANWDPPQLGAAANNEERRKALAEWTTAHPSNVPGLKLYLDALRSNDQWEELIPVAERLATLMPPSRGSESPNKVLAMAYQKLKNSDGERRVLQEVIRHDAAAPASCLRLMEIERSRQDWPALRAAAERCAQVSPFAPPVHRALAEAAAHLNEPAAALASWRLVLSFAPDDVANVHFQLAQLYAQENDPVAARRHVLRSLERAPRFRDAQELLIQLTPSPKPAGF